MQTVTGYIALFFGLWLFVFLFIFNMPILTPFTVMFGFPDIYHFFFIWLVRGWPVMTLFLLIGSVLLFIRVLYNRNNSASLYILGALIIPAIFASLFESYNESRYIFHLYPLIVIIFSMIVFYIFKNMLILLKLSKNKNYFLATVLSSIFILLAIKDANPLFAWDVGERTYTSHRDPVRAILSWEPYANFHQDHYNPAMYVKNNKKPEDKVMVAGLSWTVGVYHYYLNGLDYYFPPSKGQSAVIRNGEYIHYITGSKSVVGLTELEQTISSADGIFWILMDKQILLENVIYYSEEIKNYLEELKDYIVYMGQDNKSIVIKINKI
ncbi:MAG: hypothetical protein GF372_05020 [Candidatus Marinimicrobia bacterium]|nr:hypothetical protein [Candidatus Neomarinimicrobiota bacterium]